MLRKLIAFYRIINLLSIDVAVGAVCSALFFAKILEVHILPYGLASLGLTVWIIYTADHLLDGRKIKNPAATARHQFHQQHFQLLLICLGAAIAIDGVIILFVRKPVLISGIVVASLVGVYLLIHRHLKFLKEFFIALFYTVGVLLPSVSVTSLSWSEWPWILIVLFLLTALINLFLFSWFDYEKDLRDGNISFVTILGRKASRIFIITLFIIAFTLCFVFLFSGIGFTIMLMMNLILIIIFVFYKYFSKRDRFRLFGELAFLIPIFSQFI